MATSASDRTPVGVSDPQEPIAITVTRAQAWDIYDLLIAKARVIEDGEDQVFFDLGSGRYARAADALRAQLSAPTKAQERRSGAAVQQEGGGRV